MPALNLRRVVMPDAGQQLLEDVDELHKVPELAYCPYVVGGVAGARSAAILGAEAGY